MAMGSESPGALEGAEGAEADGNAGVADGVGAFERISRISLARLGMQPP